MTSINIRSGSQTYDIFTNAPKAHQLQLFIASSVKMEISAIATKYPSISSLYYDKKKRMTSTQMKKEAIYFGSAS